MVSEKDQSLIVPRKINFMVSLTTEFSFLQLFAQRIVLGASHVWLAWLSWFCTYIAIGKMVTLLLLNAANQKI